MIRNENIENQIKKYFSKFKQIQRPCVEKYLNEHENIKNYLNQILNDTPEWLLITNIIQGIIKNFDLEICKICGKKIKYHRSILFGKIQTYCSNKCSMNDPKVYKKVILKSKQTMLKKYGVKYPLQSKQIQEKFKNTCIKKYGVNNPLKSNIIKEKMKNTCIEKYGGNAPASSKAVQEKMKNTCIERYGVDNSSKSKIIKEKIKNTCIKKYGVDNFFKSKKIKQLNTKIQLKKGYQTLLKLKDYVIPLFTLNEYKGKNSIYKWKCIKCGNEFEQKIYTTNFNKQFNSLPRCLKCYPFNSGFSQVQKQLAQFCRQYFPNLIENDKNLIKPLQLDILIPQIKLAIQFNGLYYHQYDENNKEYHLIKTKLCNQQGYRLIHIWQDQWIINNKELKEKLKDIFLNKEKLIFIDNMLLLDKSWYNNIIIPNYEYLVDTPTYIIFRNHFKIENCGYSIYQKLN